MRRFAALGMALVGLLAGSGAEAADRAEFERKVAENKARFEAAKAENQRKFEELRARHQARFEEMRNGTRLGAPSGSHAASETRTLQPIPYDVAKAPAPGACLVALFDKAKVATSAEQLLPYLPANEARTLQESQKQYDPAMAAQRRERLRKESPHLTPEELDHLTRSPYEGALLWYGNLGRSFIRVMDYRVEENRARLKVSLHSTLRTRSSSDGPWEEYPYGTADVEMVCEGPFWRLRSFVTNRTHYKDPP